MKRFLIVLTMVTVFATTAQAQFLNFGVRVGTGFATHVDDLADNSPILAANVGGFVTYGFTQSASMLADVFRLQTGVNIIRRGCKFQEVLEMAMSIREGSYDAWYAQIPLLATIRYELPIREPGHYALLSVGPAVSIGMIGTVKDRKFTRGLPQGDWNYLKNESAFNVMNRIDANLLFGVGYEYQDLSIMLQLDYGFMAVTETPDAIESLNGANSKVPMGNNMALLLTVGYQFPFR
jgi:hypothetical protein